MRRPTVILGIIGIAGLLAACGGTAATPARSSAGSTTPLPLTSPDASGDDEALAPQLAWTFGDEATTDAGDVDLAFSGGHEFAGNAVTLDGQTGFAASVLPAPVSTTSGFSVGAWVSLAEPIEFAAAVSQVGEEAAAFYLGVGESTWDFAMKDADTNEPGHTIRAKADLEMVDLDGWFHLVGVHDVEEGEIRLYVNGMLAGAADFHQPWQAQGDLTIGRSQAHFAQADFWPGSISSVAIYQHVLTSEEIRDIHETTEPTGAPPLVESQASALIGTWDYAFDETGKEAVLANFAGLVDSADQVVVRIGFDGNDWWLGFVFDGDLFLLDGVPEGDGGSFILDDDVMVMTGAHGRARITYVWEVAGDSLSLTAVEECAVSGSEMTCRDAQSEMDPMMLLVTDQTFIRSGDDPSY